MKQYEDLTFINTDNNEVMGKMPIGTMQDIEAEKEALEKRYDTLIKVIGDEGWLVTV